MENKKHKILIISLPAGAGHTQAAKALLETAKKYPEIECRHLDMYDFITYTFKQAAVSAYDLLVKNMPEVWGFLYEKSDNPKMVKNFNTLTKRLKQINAGKFYREIEKFNPDSIICTHFLPAEMINNPPKKYSLHVPPATIITDYDLHGLWINNGTSHYFVSTPKMQWKLLNRKAQTEQNITISGIPIDPKFYIANSKKSLKEK